jgi:hypothetical protein
VVVAGAARPDRVAVELALRGEFEHHLVDVLRVGLDLAGWAGGDDARQRGCGLGGRSRVGPPHEEAAVPAFDAAAEAAVGERRRDALPEALRHPPPDGGTLDAQRPVPDDDTVHTADSSSGR